MLTSEDISRNETTEGLWSFSSLIVGGEDECQGDRQDNSEELHLKSLE